MFLNFIICSLFKINFLLIMRFYALIFMVKQCIEISFILIIEVWASYILCLSKCLSSLIPWSPVLFTPWWGRGTKTFCFSSAVAFGSVELPFLGIRWPLPGVSPYVFFSPCVSNFVPRPPFVTVILSQTYPYTVGHSWNVTLFHQNDYFVLIWYRLEIRNILFNLLLIPVVPNSKF